MRWIDTLKLRGKIDRYHSPELHRAIQSVVGSANMAGIAQLQKKTSAARTKEPTSAAKYAEPRYWLLLNALRTAELGMHAESGLSILDIGSGPGYFLAMARALGHDVHGLEAPEDFLNPVEREIYSGLTQALYVSDAIRPLLIQRFTALPFRGPQFDLITAFWICFNRHRQPDEWGVDEWRFFVEDALRCVRPGGRVFLELNENPERYGQDFHFYDRETRDYFESVGRVDRGRVLITASR